MLDFKSAAFRPLWYCAAAGGKAAVLQLLADYGANLDAMGPDGRRVLWAGSDPRGDGAVAIE